MIEKNKNKQITYKNILEAAQKNAKLTNSEVTDEDIIKATKNEIKQLNDLLTFCKEGTDKYIETVWKIEYCKIMLPEQASETEIEKYLESINPDKNIGVCMKLLKEHFKSSLDGKLAQSVVKKYIG